VPLDNLGKGKNGQEIKKLNHPCMITIVVIQPVTFKAEINLLKPCTMCLPNK
jgi:hypothetical protein